MSRDIRDEFAVDKDLPAILTDLLDEFRTGPRLQGRGAAGSVLCRCEFRGCHASLIMKCEYPGLESLRDRMLKTLSYNQYTGKRSAFKGSGSALGPVSAVIVARLSSADRVPYWRRSAQTTMIIRQSNPKSGYRSIRW